MRGRAWVWVWVRARARARVSVSMRVRVWVSVRVRVSVSVRMCVRVSVSVSVRMCVRVGLARQDRTFVGLIHHALSRARVSGWPMALACGAVAVCCDHDAAWQSINDCLLLHQDKQAVGRVDDGPARSKRYVVS